MRDEVKYLQRQLMDELRRQTGMGLMDCKMVLTEHDWDFKASWAYYASGQYRKDRPHTLLDSRKTVGE